MRAWAGALCWGVEPGLIPVEWAALWDRLPDRRILHEVLYPALRRHPAGPSGARRFLELGYEPMFNAVTASYLTAEAGDRYYAVDLVPKPPPEAGELLVADAVTLAWAEPGLNGSFDVATSFGVLGHVELAPAHAALLVASLRQLLHAGSVLALQLNARQLRKYDFLHQCDYEAAVRTSVAAHFAPLWEHDSPDFHFGLYRPGRRADRALAARAARWCAPARAVLCAAGEPVALHVDSAERLVVLREVAAGHGGFYQVVGTRPRRARCVRRALVLAPRDCAAQRVLANASSGDIFQVADLSRPDAVAALVRRNNAYSATWDARRWPEARRA